MRNVMLAAVLLLLPLASAQEGTGIVLTATDDVPTIHWKDGGQLNYTVAVGCLELILTGGNASVTVSGEGASWLTVTPTTSTVDPAACATDGTTTQIVSGTVTLTADESAPGLQNALVNLTATLTRATAEAITSDDDATFQVGYKPGHTFTPDVAFPLGVAGDMVSFNVTINITANAPTMFMYDMSNPGVGELSGLIIKTVSEPTEFVMPITFKVPAGEWNETAFSFDTWSHSLVDNVAGPDEMRELQTFSFINLNEGGSPNGGDGKESPGLGVAFLLVAMVALALRRR